MPRKKKEPEPVLLVPDLYELQLDEIRRGLIQRAIETAGSAEKAADLYHTNPVRFNFEAHRLGILKDGRPVDVDVEAPKEEDEDDYRLSDADAEDGLLDSGEEAGGEDVDGDPECDGDEPED